MDCKRTVALEGGLDSCVPRVESPRACAQRNSANIERIGVVAAEFLSGDAVPHQRRLHLVAGVAILAIAGEAHARATRSPECEIAATLRAAQSTFQALLQRPRAVNENPAIRIVASPRCQVPKAPPRG